MTDSQEHVSVEVEAALLDTVRTVVFSESIREQKHIGNVLDEAGVQDMRGELDVMYDTDVRSWLVEAALKHFLHYASKDLILVD